MGRLCRRPLQLGALWLAFAPPWAVAQPLAAPELLQAHVEYEIGHRAQAFALYAALADRGHAEAARIALQMWRYGPQLYAMSFAAQPEQLAYWLQLLACAPPRAMRCIAAAASR